MGSCCRLLACSASYEGRASLGLPSDFALYTDLCWPDVDREMVLRLHDINAALLAEWPSVCAGAVHKRTIQSLVLVRERENSVG